MASAAGTAQEGQILQLAMADYRDTNSGLFLSPTINIRDIAERVVIIPDQAFSNYINLRVVHIPNSVHEIHAWAFYSCESLTSANIPPNVVWINDNAFRGCTSIASISISKSLHPVAGNPPGIIFSSQCQIEQLRPGTFAHCTNLKTVNIPTSVRLISANCFGYCSSLETITIPDTVTHIGHAFLYCSSLKTLRIPRSIDALADFGFEGCDNLMSISMPLSIMDSVDFERMEQVALSMNSCPLMRLLHFRPQSAEADNTHDLSLRCYEFAALVVERASLETSDRKSLLVVTPETSYLITCTVIVTHEDEDGVTFVEPTIDRKEVTDATKATIIMQVLRIVRFKQTARNTSKFHTIETPIGTCKVPDSMFDQFRTPKIAKEEWIKQTMVMNRLSQYRDMSQTTTIPPRVDPLPRMPPEISQMVISPLQEDLNVLWENKLLQTMDLDWRQWFIVAEVLQFLEDS